MFNLNCVSLAGVLATTILMMGCDRPHDEPRMPKPELLQQEPLTYGAPSVQQEVLTYGGPTETRSQAEYSAQMESEITDDSISGSRSDAELADGFQESDEDSRLW